MRCDKGVYGSLRPVSEELHPDGMITNVSIYTQRQNSVTEQAVVNTK